jgi:SAM-dependent methyltransferase
MALVDRPTVALYAAHAAQWAATRGGPADDLAQRFREQVGEGTILDAGCGVGRYLGELGEPTVGLDATPAMLDLARHRRVPLACGDLERLPFAGQAFGGIFARHSYLHLPKERTPQAFAEAARVLRPGAALLVTLIPGDYEGRALSGDDIPGRWFSLWGAGELGAVLDGAGFTDVHVEEILTRRGRDLLARARRHRIRT